MKEKLSITLNSHILREIDGIVDNIYIRNRSQAIEHLVGKALGENKHAVLLAGGEEAKLKIGKREYCVTAKKGEMTIVEMAVKKLRDHGFRNVYLVGRHKIITKVFAIMKDGAKYGVKMHYVEESGAKGSADSLRLVNDKIGSNFLVVYADIVFNKINIEELWNDHIRNKAVATIMLTTSNKPSEKGTVKVEGKKVLEFTQKPSESDIYLVFSPIFVTTPEIFAYQGASLENDVFPSLTKKMLLNGYLSSQKEIHIHSQKDLDKW